jgi:hypothetical protein
MSLSIPQRRLPSVQQSPPTCSSYAATIIELRLPEDSAPRPAALPAVRPRPARLLAGALGLVGAPASMRGAQVRCGRHRIVAGTGLA